MAGLGRNENPNSLPDITTPLEQHAAWKQAKTTYEEAKSHLKAKDLELIMDSDEPDDLTRFLEKVKADRGPYAKTMEFTQKCLSVLKEREGPIDMLVACAGPPGRLAWGSTKLVLCIVCGYVDEFKSLLSMLEDIAKWLEPVKVDAETFQYSKVVQESLVNLYVCIIKFWEKAIIAYTSKRKKRSRLLHWSDAMWKELGKEAESLKSGIDTQVRIFQHATNAAHHKQSKQADDMIVIGKWPCDMELTTPPLPQYLQSMPSLHPRIHCYDWL
jgi:hypothetical protein